MSGDAPTNQALGVLEDLNEALTSGDSERLQNCFSPEQAYSLALFDRQTGVVEQERTTKGNGEVPITNQGQG